MKRILWTAGLMLVAGAAAAADPVANPPAQKSDAIPLGGIVSPNGSLQIPSNRFSVSHPSTGRYVITFKPGYAKAAICAFQPVGAGVRVSNYSLNNRMCDVTFVSLTTNQPADTLFTFVSVNAG